MEGYSGRPSEKLGGRTAPNHAHVDTPGPKLCPNIASIKQRTSPGKIRFLDDTYGTGMYATAPDNTGRPFDLCDCDIVLLEDVENGQVPPLSLFKRLTDWYLIQVHIKGGHIWWRPKTVVFTSNQHPHEWWPNLSEFD